MRPMLSRKVVKGKQDRFIFLQAFAGFWEFGLVTGEELIVGRQSCFASRRQVHFMDQLLGLALNALRHFIQDVSYGWSIRISCQVVVCALATTGRSRAPSRVLTYNEFSLNLKLLRLRCCCLRLLRNQGHISSPQPEQDLAAAIRFQRLLNASLNWSSG